MYVYHVSVKEIRIYTVKPGYLYFKDNLCIKDAFQSPKLAFYGKQILY